MEQKVINILKEVLDTDNVDNTCSQSTCEGWDSMAQLNISVEIESEFGVSLEPEEMAEMTSVSKIIELLKAKGL